MPARRRSQSERTAGTRAALVGAGRRLFAEHGAANVSAEQLVAEAGLTRGALYHHFSGKDDVFRAVFREIEAETAAEIAPVLQESAATLDVRAPVAAFLDSCERPEVRRIALIDAPVVLGWQEWREIEHEYFLGMLITGLQALAAAGFALPGSPEVLAQLLFSMSCEAALVIATADDPVAARADAEEALVALFVAGMKPVDPDQQTS
ncbi:TetR/AcrR family transcriptional regulator [Pseudonocardia endophytica]|uniref:TetR family transcriptional regulator n=1 Tax=Pseudonocardia endophytica TaxID=401976 RepID=A0A4R1HI95_PSEEN|nr:TetR/AcrR family transcriptional regulator [Pseudonocardia endophytica]TCK20030.1 TetR family transcriptional regulator [Pseudonocardia endophytica]